jgi:hypothetical protein
VVVELLEKEPAEYDDGDECPPPLSRRDRSHARRSENSNKNNGESHEGCLVVASRAASGSPDRTQCAAQEDDRAGDSSTSANKDNDESTPPRKATLRRSRYGLNRRRSRPVGVQLWRVPPAVRRLPRARTAFSVLPIDRHRDTHIWKAIIDP